MDYFDDFRASLNSWEFGEEASDFRTNMLCKYMLLVDAAYKKETKYQEYCKLQVSWNYPVLQIISKYLISGIVNRDKIISLGPFLGLTESALSTVFKDVCCVDLNNFLYSPTSNMRFHQADMDGGDWELPDEHFNILMAVEFLEHLMWSPVSFLRWAKSHVDMLIITTPDDSEWPPMQPKPWTRYQHWSSIPAAHPGVKGNPAPMFHCKQYTQDEFVELLTATGFRILELRRIGFDSKQMLAICTSR